MQGTLTAWFFTFGENHTYPGTGEPLNQRYTAIVGDRDAAIGHMTRHFGDQWQGPFATREDAHVDAFGLTRLRSKFWPKQVAK